MVSGMQACLLWGFLSALLAVLLVTGSSTVRVGEGTSFWRGG
jgi:hypothetical protein